MNSADFEAIQRLKSEWDSLQPLSKENEDRLWRKLRLEWDYHSNHIEGNTLTYGETELLIIFGETRGSHTLREYEEMKAHDVAIQHIREVAKESRPLSEADVRGLNKLILKDPFWKPAITPDGSPTQKQIVPGQYKVQPNNVRTPTGEPFNFVDPLDVPKRMQEYLATLNGESPAGSEFLIYLAQIHHEFLLIHPFDDGNGRVGRLLLNYALLKRGFLPVVIRTEQKSRYLLALHHADTENRDYSELGAFLGAALYSSLKLGVTAAKGESIEEPSDVEKEIVIFAKQAKRSPARVPRSDETSSLLWHTVLLPLFNGFAEKTSALKVLFEEVVLLTIPSGTAWRRDLLNASSEHRQPSFLFRVDCRNYNRDSSHPFSHTSILSVSFEKYEYTISSTELGPLFTGNYGLLLKPPEIEEIIGKALRGIFERIKKEAESP